MSIWCKPYCGQAVHMKAILYLSLHLQHTFKLAKHSSGWFIEKTLSSPFTFSRVLADLLVLCDRYA